MKKLSLIVASLLLLSGVIFYSCTKEDNIKTTQNEPVVNNNKEARGIERLFDEKYVQLLINVSGIDPKKLSQDEAIWDPFHNGLRAINACFMDKYLYFLENQPWNAAYCLERLNSSRDYFAVGDTLNGLTAANQAYAMAGCGSLTPFFYQGHSFDLPALDIAKQIRTFNSEMTNLIKKYPTLNKIDEQYKIDIITLAIFYSENGDTKANCRAQFSMAYAAAVARGVMCSAGCGSLIIPHFIVAAQIICASLCVYECYVAYDDYKSCLQGH